MAKTRDRSTSGSSAAGLPAATEEPGGIMGRLGRIVRTRPFAASGAPTTGDGKSPARPRSDMGRFFTGMMAYVIGSFLLQYVLLLANSTFKLHLDQPQSLFPRNTPYIGAMSSFAIIYLLFLIALIWGLYRFNVMPRDPFGARRRAAEQAANNAATSTGTRARSRRRRGTTTSASSAAHAPSTTRRASAAPRPTLTRAATDGTSDEHYERVKAMQRLRRRKR